MQNLRIVFQFASPNFMDAVQDEMKEHLLKGKSHDLWYLLVRRQYWRDKLPNGKTTDTLSQWLKEVEKQENMEKIAILQRYLSLKKVIYFC